MSNSSRQGSHGIWEVASVRTCGGECAERLAISIFLVHGFTSPAKHAHFQTLAKILRKLLPYFFGATEGKHRPGSQRIVEKLAPYCDRFSPSLLGQDFWAGVLCAQACRSLSWPSTNSSLWQRPKSTWANSRVARLLLPGSRRSRGRFLLESTVITAAVQTHRA